jgi:hypothetical protein
MSNSQRAKFSTFTIKMDNVAQLHLFTKKFCTLLSWGFEKYNTDLESVDLTELILENKTHHGIGLLSPTAFASYTLRSS